MSTGQAVGFVSVSRRPGGRTNQHQQNTRKNCLWCRW